MGISGPIPPMPPFFQEIAGLYFLAFLMVANNSLVRPAGYFLGEKNGGP